MINVLKTMSLGVAAVALLTATPIGELVPGMNGEAVALQQKEKSTRKVPAMTLAAHKHIQKAQEAMDAKLLDEASTILDELKAKGKVNDYELAVVWQLKASISFEQDDTPNAIRAFEEILKLRDSIPEALETNILFSLAQLYYTEEKYDTALDYVQRWESATDLISVNQLVFIAQLHYVKEDFKNSLDYIYRAISDAEAVDTVEVKENWYSIALSAHWELNQYDKVRDVLEILVVTWPKPIYWTQLAGVYGELEQQEVSYSLTEAAYKQGFLDDKPVQLVNVAQIMIAREAPIKAAWVLEKALAEDRIKNNADNARLLGQAYMRASEFKKAIRPLKAAAEELNDGDMWFQVGQVEAQFELYGDSAVSLGKAISAFRKDGAKKNQSKIFSAYLQQSSAHTEDKSFDAAAKSLEAAGKVADGKREVSQIKSWESYMKAEQAREKILADAGIK